MYQLPSHFAEQSRVWIYTAKPTIVPAQQAAIAQDLAAFTHQWVSHNRQLQATYQLLHDRFIVLAVDETRAGASGCSIDKSVHFLQQLQGAFQLDLFDRMQFSYWNGEQAHTLDRDQFTTHYQAGTITDETLVFDTLVATKAQFETGFLKPLGQSWISRFIPSA